MCGALGAVEGVAFAPAEGEAADEDVGEGDGLFAVDGVGDLGEKLGVVLADGLGEGGVDGDEGFDFPAAGAVHGEGIFAGWRGVLGRG